MPLDLPPRRARARRYGPSLVTFALSLKTATPVLGGAARTRSTDDHDPVRVPGIAGQLRLFWRALHGAGLSPAELAAKEQSRFGATAGDSGTASPIRIAVQITHPGSVDESEIRLADPSTVALFSARRTNTGDPTAPRRNDVAFDLRIDVEAPYAAELRETIQAWLCFGGIGGRTRRGAGTVTLTKDREAWLPRDPDALAQLLRAFAPATGATSMPSLKGARLLVGQPSAAPQAWEKALTTWREFRQGMNSNARVRPGRNDPEPGRPGRSNWPEADKVRALHLERGGRLNPHQPRFNATPAWPRAQLGLPIVAQFQLRARDGGPNYVEPQGFELGWASAEGKLRDRLASPAIVKAMPLADGRFVPIILWFHRALPQGKVGIRSHAGVLVAGSEAPFERMPKDIGDPDLTGLLGNHPDLRSAFCAWATTQGFRSIG